MWVLEPITAVTLLAKLVGIAVSIGVFEEAGLHGGKIQRAE